MKEYPFKLRGTARAIQDVRSFLEDYLDEHVTVTTKFNKMEPNDLLGTILANDPAAAIRIWREIDRFRGLLRTEISGLSEVVAEATS